MNDNDRTTTTPWHPVEDTVLPTELAAKAIALRRPVFIFQTLDLYLVALEKMLTNEPIDGSQSTLQPWAGGAVVSAPILVSGGQRFESSPVHFFSLLSLITVCAT